MVSGSKGTKMPRGDKQQIMQYPIVNPSVNKLADFNDVAVPVLNLIAVNKDESKRLSNIRNTLLPRLMSGEIDVSDIDL